MEGPVSSRSKVTGRGGARGDQRGVGPRSMERTSLTSWLYDFGKLQQPLGASVSPSIK